MEHQTPESKEDTMMQPEASPQLRLSVKQVLAAIMLLTPDEKIELWKMLPLLIEEFEVNQRERFGLSVNGEKESEEINCGQDGIYSTSTRTSTTVQQTQALNERLENLLDQQIFNSVESELAQRACGKRPDGWLTWEEACAE